MFVFHYRAVNRLTGIIERFTVEAAKLSEASWKAAEFVNSHLMPMGAFRWELDFFEAAPAREAVTT